jgi:predicted unusual protein kinase regulating ubiquinone biosynthesis (AarF/ABC1/UbiB family)
MRASETPASNSQPSGVVADLPRRQFFEVSDGDVPLSQMKFVSFQTNRAYSFKRLLTWLKLLLSFLLNILTDIILGRDSIERRAVNLRCLFGREGGSFVKLGIHLSMRVDFMPWIYCNELSRMTDHMEPFPVTQAISIIERSTGKPLSATFSQFDPVPVLSSSVANTYQAILQSGVKVVVKVRRPGIGEQFMADLQAFDWLLSIAEFLTIFRPGFTRGMRADFRNLLIEELDFVQEARRQDAFRRAAAKTGIDFFSAPRINLDLSGEEVVVNEFASGMWLWELLAGIETGNETVLAQAREMNIDPRKVAKRLLWVNNWSWEENLFFHADPYPTNIIIGRNSVVYLINFTSTGTLSSSKRQAMHQNLYYAAQRDPQNMARSSLVLMEPLPPIDIIELSQELESYNWQMIYALEAAPESLSWQERTSVIQWIGMMRLARKYGIVLDIQVLRMLRATLLVESIAVRLHPKINFVDQYWKFDRFRAEQARRRVTNSILDQLDGKTNERLVIRVDRIVRTVEDFILRARHMLTLPTVNFSSLMSKWSFAFYILFRYIGQILGVTALAVMSGYAVCYFKGLEMPSLPSLAKWIMTNPVYLLSLLALTFVNGRTVLFRMDDKEIS